MSVSKPFDGTLWLAKDGTTVCILNQTRLPHESVVRRLTTVAQAAEAIVTMQVRGAPLIGVTAAFGLALAMWKDSSDRGLAAAHELLIATRPTAVNLRWALDAMREHLAPLDPNVRTFAAYAEASRMLSDDIATNRAIGEHGLRLIRSALKKRRGTGPVRILTHCNAGRLGTLGWGTATAPMYLAHEAGIPIHVWVSETRPRNQGAALTAWELGQAGIPLTVVVDNAAGHLLQRGLVDLVLVGADRVTANGDAANKIGTYLKALAAKAHRVPFYVAFPGTTIDWTLRDGVREIPIEERSAREVTHVVGASSTGRLAEVRVTPEGVAARNDAFDVTPAHLITGLITERGVCRATAAGLKHLFPEATSGMKSPRPSARRGSKSKSNSIKPARR